MQHEWNDFRFPSRRPSSARWKLAGWVSFDTKMMMANAMPGQSKIPDAAVFSDSAGDSISLGTNVHRSVWADDTGLFIGMGICA